MRFYCIMHLPFVAFIELAEFTCSRTVQMHKLFLLQAFLSPSSAGVFCKCKNYCFDYSTDRVLSFNSKPIPVVEEIGGRKECTNFSYQKHCSLKHVHYLSYLRHTITRLPHRHHLNVSC